MRRLKEREKKDNCTFEKIEFQLKLKEHYESNWFKEIFERKNTRIIYIDSGISLESSKQQARDFYKQYLRK